MFFRRHPLLLIALTAACAVWAASAEAPNPFGQAGNPATSATTSDPLEFAGVSTIGSKTMINLYDREAKHGFWVQEGKTSDGVTVVKYDAAHDQVVVRRNGAEKTLPLRAPGPVVNGPATATPIAPALAAPPAPVGPTAPTSAPSTAATPSNDPAANTPQARAKQEEEARMLVSDLLEIGIAQRKAYEDAQRRAAAGQSAQANSATQPATPAANPPPPPPAPAQTSSATPAPTGG
jgi:hypothetical protein